MPPTPFPRQFNPPADMPEIEMPTPANKTVSLWFGNPENWMPKQFLGADELAEFADFVIKQYKDEQPEELPTTPTFTATQNKSGWRIEQVGNSTIAQVHQSFCGLA